MCEKNLNLFQKNQKNNLTIGYPLHDPIKPGIYISEYIFDFSNRN